MQNAPPTIFSPKRRKAARRRLLAKGLRDAFLLEDMVDDVIERLAFLRHEPKRSLIIGDATFRLNQHIDPSQASVMDADIIHYFDHLEIDLESPLEHGPYDFIACLGLLDTVNDLPGALIHLREALAPGGRVIAQFLGAGSLANLRAAMLAADGERPAARMHPMVDVRSAAQLLQRAGWSDPVVDSRTRTVSYRSLDKLVSDLRDQGLGSVLAAPPPPLTRKGLERARSAFLEAAGPDGRVTESFEILTLTGRRSLRGS